MGVRGLFQLRVHVRRGRARGGTLTGVLRGTLGGSVKRAHEGAL